MSVKLNIGEETVVLWDGIPGRNILRLPFSLNLAPAVYKVEANVNMSSSPGGKYIAKTNLIILPYKSNEVKTDRLTGGLFLLRFRKRRL
jgi:hypothetical protein